MTCPMENDFMPMMPRDRILNTLEGREVVFPRRSLILSARDAAAGRQSASHYSSRPVETSIATAA